MGKIKGCALKAAAPRRLLFSPARAALPAAAHLLAIARGASRFLLRQMR